MSLTFKDTTLILVRVVREVAPRNAPLPMVVRAAGRLSSVSEVQFWKAPFPIVVRPMGRRRSHREVQPEKAPTPMVVRAAGKASSVRPRHSSGRPSCLLRSRRRGGVARLGQRTAVEGLVAHGSQAGREGQLG